MLKLPFATVFTGLLPPHAVSANPEIVKSSSETIIGQRFLHLHPANIPSTTRLKLTGDPGPGKLCQGPRGAASAAFAAVVVITSVAVDDPLGTRVTLAGLTTQLALVGAPEQVRATVPVNPPVGVIVTVEVSVAPGDAMLAAVAATVKLGGVTIGAMTVKLIPVPERLVPLLKA